MYSHYYYSVTLLIGPVYKHNLKNNMLLFNFSNKPMQQDKLGSEAPPILNNMIGKKCLFEVKITSKNTPGHEYYAVARLFETLNNDAKDSATTGLVQNDGEGTSSSADKGKAKKQKTA